MRVQVSLLRMILSLSAKIPLVSIVLSDKMNSGPGCFPLMAKYDTSASTEHTVRWVLPKYKSAFCPKGSVFNCLICKCTTSGVCLLSNETSENDK